MSANPIANVPSRRSQRAIENTILLSCGAWFLPYVAGIACSVVEIRLISKVYEDLGIACPSSLRDDIFWYFRSKTLGINVATYAPIIGIPAQIIEVYLLGQFTLYCAQNLKDFNAAGLDAQWCHIESTLISGEQLLSAIEVSIGKPLDIIMRSRLANAANTFSRAYLTAMSIPGLRTVQTKAVMGVRRMFDSVDKMLHQSFA